LRQQKPEGQVQPDLLAWLEEMESGSREKQNGSRELQTIRSVTPTRKTDSTTKRSSGSRSQRDGPSPLVTHVCQGLTQTQVSRLTAPDTVVAARTALSRMYRR
jgi:hypothetical protein